MNKFIALSVLLITLTANSAQAYFRCNTTKCEQAMLRDREERVEKKLASAKTSEQKSELSEEIEAIQYEAKRLEEKSRTSATATNK